VHTLDVIAVGIAVAAVVVLSGLLARQRHMLRSAGAIPIAVRGRSARWQYGIARYVGAELRWYRALGLGTRPTRVLRQGEVRLVSTREPEPAELASLPPAAVIIECRDGRGPMTMAFGESAYTGFVSWIEASSPPS
jgi:Protein of unknown function (DUF2550)